MQTDDLTQTLREAVVNECVGVIRGIAMAYETLPSGATVTREEIVEALNAGADKLPVAFEKRWAELDSESS
jgi:hypothetical protein